MKYDALKCEKMKYEVVKAEAFYKPRLRDFRIAVIQYEPLSYHWSVTAFGALTAFVRASIYVLCSSYVTWNSRGLLF